MLTFLAGSAHELPFMPLSFRYPFARYPEVQGSMGCFLSLLLLLICTHGRSALSGGGASSAPFACCLIW